MKPADRQMIEDFLDDGLSVAEMEVFAKRVKQDDAFAENLREAVQLHGAVRAASVADLDGIELQTRVELALGPDGRACPFTDEVMQRLEPEATKPKRHWRKVVLYAAPLWVAALFVLVFFIGAASSGPHTVAKVENLPLGTILTRNAEVRQLTADDVLQSGDWLEVPEAATLTFSLTDGSRVSLFDRANVQIAGEDGNHITLLRGTLSAQVEPRSKDQAMTVRTDCGVATVLGTIFEFSAAPNRSELLVEEGVVSLSSTGKELLVHSGERGLARRGKAPVLVDDSVRAAAEAQPPAPYVAFRQERGAALIRFSPETFAGTIPESAAADVDTWVRQCAESGMDRVLLEAWSLSGVRSFAGDASRSAAEITWQNRFGDLVERTSRACLEEGIAFGVACPLNQPAVARLWLPELLQSKAAISEVHFTDLGDQAARYVDWRDLVLQFRPNVIVSMAESPRYAANSVPDAPLGRYVRVSLEVPDALLMLSEFEVFSDGENVALGQPTKQNSTGWGGDCSRAVDGNNSPNYPSRTITHTYYHNNPWWEVDLGRNRLLDSIRIWNRTDAHADHFKDFRIQIRDEDERIVWDGWFDTLGERTKVLSFENAGAWRPARRHLAFRESRYYQPIADTKLTGGREVFVQAMDGFADGAAPTILLTPGLDGRIPGYEVESLMHYRALWRLSFDRPVSAGATVSSSSGVVEEGWLSNGTREHAWQGEEWSREGKLELVLPRAQKANALLLREPISLGSRSPTAEVFVRKDGKWERGGTKILNGDRLLRFADGMVDAVKVHFKHARFAPAVEEAVLVELPQAAE